MAFEISQFNQSLKEVCEKFEVLRLDLFGSALREDFDPDRSDLDFLVTFEDSTEIGLFDRFFGLQEKLQTIFNCEVDLVEEKAIRNPYFRKVVNRERKIVFAR